MNKIRSLIHSLSFQIIFGIVLLLCVSNCVAGVIGYLRFTESLTREYNDSAFRTAETAATLVNGDKIFEYLENGGDSDEYRDRWERMNILCQRQNVTLIYVISVDTSDYNGFYSVFNTVNDKSGYSPWDVGYFRETTNEEYRQIYQDMYENGLQRGTVVRTNNLRGRAPHITSLIPIADSQGKVQAILCVERPMEELKTGRMAYLRWVGTATCILILLASIGTVISLKNHILTPLKKVIQEAERFAKERTKLEEEQLGKVSRITEISVLGNSVEKMENDVIGYMDELTLVTAERERIDTELTLANKIQSDMLPNIFPPFPERHEFDIYASMDPAKEVGGDFYDFFLIDETHLGLVIADVSGKGIPAALFMMMSKILINNYAMMGETPGQVLKNVNNTICKNNENDMFVTIWFGILDVSNGRVVAANAGHEYPAIRKADGSFELFKDKHGLAIGAMEGVPYKEYEFMLGKGDTLFVYTDGVPEATDLQDTLFGTDRMLEALNHDPDASPEELLHNVKTAVGQFVGEAPQFDDLTMLAIKIKNE